jgi:hypothetical protein
MRVSGAFRLFAKTVKRSGFLFCRASCPKTGSHFSVKRSGFLFCRASCPKTGSHFSVKRFGTAWVLAGLFALTLSGCTTDHSVKILRTASPLSLAEKKILIVPPKVTLGELTSGGEIKARPDWTKAAQASVAEHLNAFMAQKRITTAQAEDLADLQERLLAKLHDTAGRAVLTNVTDGIDPANNARPSPWTLGPAAAELHARYGADYALFLSLEDAYTPGASETQQAGAFVACAITGVCVQPSSGNQAAFATLVDLTTGNIVWFNFLADGAGDLRDDENARRLVATILKELPLERPLP